MRIGSALLLLVLLAPRPAEAAVRWASGLDICHDNGTTDLTFFTSASGVVDVESTIVDTDDGNICSRKFDPASGVAEYRGIDTGAVTGTFIVGERIYATSAPTLARMVLRFTDGTETGCLLTAVASGAGYKLSTYFEDTGDECDGGDHTMDGTECGRACTTVADCADGLATGTCCPTAACCDGAVSCTADAGCSGGDLCTATQCRSGTCVNECLGAAVNPCEASCTSAAHATTPEMAFGTWYGTTMKQLNGTGEATCSLWSGTTADNGVVRRGGKTRPQGKCWDGTNAHFACAVDADCPSSTCEATCLAGTDQGDVCKVDTDCTGSTCRTNDDLPTVDEARFGTDDTVADTFVYYLDEPLIDDANVNPNYRIEYVVTDGDGVITGNWSDTGCSSSPWLCVDDGASEDANTTHMEMKAANCAPCTAANHAHDFTTADFTAQPSPWPTPMAVLVATLAIDGDSSGTQAAKMTVNIGDGTNVSAVGTEFNLEDFDGNGGTGGTYQLPPNEIFLLAPDGGTWTRADLTNLETRIEKTDQLTSGDQGRVTAIATEILWDITDPNVPTVLPDRDGDGVDTACIVGDSTFASAPFSTALQGGLLEPTNLYLFAKGGITLGDVTENIDVSGANNDLVEGSGTTWISGIPALFGGFGDTCDVFVIAAVVNTFHNANVVDPEQCVYTLDRCVGGTNDGTSCTADSECTGSGTCSESTCAEYGAGQMGYCDDRGGADDGNACLCDPTAWRESDPSTGATRYCRVKRSSAANDWLDDCTASADCKCDADIDCCINGDGTTCADTTATCSGVGGTCGQSIAYAGTRVNPASAQVGTWCVSGCKNAPGCTSGLCLASHSQSRAHYENELIQAAVDARTSDGPPLIVWGAPPPARINGLAGWPGIARQVAAYRHTTLGQATRWVDIYGAFQRDCRTGGFRGLCGAEPCSGECYADDVHWTEYGQQVAAQIIIDCLTNASGTNDGTCTTNGCSDGAGGTQTCCTTGKIGDTCATDLDCALYSCDFS